MPREVCSGVLLCFSPSHVSVAEQFAFMAEVPAAIPADVLEAACPVVDAAAETPAAGAAGENPAPPAQEVSWFLLLAALLHSFVIL